jgi:ABC-type branched-subunit amino acid transport system ATPase component
MSESRSVLTVEGLNAWWGPAQALFDVSLTVGEGELVVLQGLNGAGKSTLLQAIMGIEVRATGQVDYFKNGHQNCLLQAGPHGSSGSHGSSGLPSHQRARLGLGYVPEDRRLFAALSVRENLRLVSRAQNHAVAPSGADERRRAANAQHRPHLDDRPQLVAARRALRGHCSHSGRAASQCLAIAPSPGHADAAGRAKPVIGWAREQSAHFGSRTHGASILDSARSVN